MKKRLYHLTLTLCFLLLGACVFAQQPVRGVLRSSAGEPLSGATVSVKGTNRSTITNAQGQFTLNAAQGNTLIASYVGYQPLEFTATAGTPLIISLTGTTGSLNEVVVVGYGTQKRRDVTGSVVSVNTKDLPQVANTSINNLL